MTVPCAWGGQALQAIEELRNAVDTLIIIPNDRLLDGAIPKIPQQHNFHSKE